jgi:hypothetical protein
MTSRSPFPFASSYETYSLFPSYLPLSECDGSEYQALLALGHFIIIESTLKTHRKASSIATVVRSGQKNYRFNQQSQKTNEIITVNENHHEVLKSMSTGSASPSTRHRRHPGTRQAMNRMTRFPYSLDSYSSSPTQSYPRP